MRLELPGEEWTYYPASIVEVGGNTYFFARNRNKNEKRLGVMAGTAGFTGEPVGIDRVWLFPLSPVNAKILRERLPWLSPSPLGLGAAVGFGDRLGLATPGHVQASRRYPGIAPVYAQQSVRENARTGRTPLEVLDQAMWGVFETGWCDPWGADADHLKTITAIDAFIDAGYTLFTIDPGDQVDNESVIVSPVELVEKIASLPWDELETTLDETQKRYLAHPIDLEDSRLVFTPQTLSRAAAKYGHAIAHTVRLSRYIAARMSPKSFDLEISVDETDTPTSPEEHAFIVSELRRLGVQWTSLAPRYIGRFEKGVDYIGDTVHFEADFAKHVAVAQALGPYKLSLHSGSDKFSIYPIISHLVGGMVHLKTAGTSYLEALRTVAHINPLMFRAILNDSRHSFEIDRASYHVSASLANMPLTSELDDADLPMLLDQFDARQVLHVTFGSILDRYSTQLKKFLLQNEDAYYTTLETHFVKHLAPFQIA